MLLVVDMNILFSFFKKYSFTRKLLINPDLELYSPKYALGELNKHLDEIKLKAKIDVGVFELYKKILSWFVEFVPVSKYKDFKEEAESISPDPEDIQYFALALELNIPILSNDSHFKEQSEVPVFTTEELSKFLNIL